MRKVFAILAIVGFATTVAQADTLLWINDSDSSAAPAQGQPTLNAEGAGNSFYVWARPDADKTLLNVSLNAVSSNPGVLDFTGVDVMNPNFGTSFGKPIQRYEFLSAGMVGSDSDVVTNFGGFTVAGTAAIGVGMGPDSMGLEQEMYDPDNDAYLVAKVNYDVTGSMDDMTEIFLQISSNGINNAGESSSQANVIFGLASDPALNGNDNRNTNSATYDAKIVVGEGGGTVCDPGYHIDPDTGECVIPEPSTLLLSAFGLLGLALAGWRKRS